MKTGTQADLKRYLKQEYGIDCSKNSISLLVKAKNYRFQYTPGGKILIASTAKALVDSGFPKMQANKKKKETSLKGEQPPPTPEEHEDDVDTGGPLTLTDDRDRIERHKAFHQSEKERINNDEKLKKLINLNEIEKKLFDILRPIRDDLQLMSKKVGLLVHSAETGHEACQIIQDESDRILLSRIGGNYLFDDELKKKILNLLMI